MTDDIEEQRKLLQLANHAGLTSMYDASIDSYTNWRSKILTFVQIIKEHELGKTIRSDTDN